MSARAADRPHPGLDAARRRRGHHAVRLPDLRGPRPAEDGLPRPAQPHDHRRRGRERSRPTGASTIDLLDACRWTTSRPTTCWPAATRWACSSSTAGRCATLLRHDEAGQLRGHLRGRRPVPAGPDGRQLAHQLRAAQERAAGRSRPIHPELEEPLREVLEPTYGLIVYQEQVQRHRPEAGRLHARPGRPAPPGHGQEEEGDPGQGVRPVPAGHAGERGYSDEAIKAVWDVLVPFAGYAFNKAHSAAYGLVSYWTAYLKANYPAEYMAGAAHLGRRRQGQVGALPGRVPPHGHQGAAAGRQRVRRDVRRGRHGHPVRPGRDPQRRRQRRRGDHRRRASPRASSPASRTSCARCRCGVCNKRVIESLIKAGAFDSLGHPRKGLLLVHEQAVDAVHRHQAQRGDRAGLDCSAGTSEAEAAFEVASPRRRMGQEAPGSISSARCSACTSRTTRCSASSTSSPGTRTSRWPS